MVSSETLYVVAGVLPLDLRAEMDMDFTVLIRWCKSVDGKGLDPESVKIRRPSYMREDLGRIPWSGELRPRALCSHYTDASKQQNNTVEFAFTAVSDGHIVVESQFCLTDGAELFVAKRSRKQLQTCIREISVNSINTQIRNRRFEP